MFTMQRWAGVCTLALAVAAPGAVAQSHYPDKSVKIIVAYQAGQGTDVATRFLAERLSDVLGQAFFIENRGGAGGNIGTDQAARSPADGYTLTMGTNATHALNAFLYPTLTFDAERDFAPVALVSTFPMVVLAHRDSPFQSVTDVLQASQAKAGDADIGLPSTTARLVLELLQKQSGVPLFGVPYRGSATAMSDVMGRQIPVSIDTISAARPQIDGGHLKPLAVTSQQETALLPGVPTVADQGLEGFEVIAWNALYAPKGTPPEVIDKLNAAVNQILAEPRTRERLLQLGHEPAGGSAQDLADLAAAERQKWAPIIEEAGITAG